MYCVKEWTAKGYEESLVVIEIFCILIVVVVSWMYTTIKTDQIEHFKWIDLIVHKLNLNSLLKIMLSKRYQTEYKL